MPLNNLQSLPNAKPKKWVQPTSTGSGVLRLLGFFTGGQPQLVVEGERERSYIVEQSPDFSNWSLWTNVTANDATLNFWPSAITDKTRFYRAACVQ
jgi:hypothetical protein